MSDNDSIATATHKDYAKLLGEIVANGGADAERCDEVLMLLGVSSLQLDLDLIDAERVAAVLRIQHRVSDLEQQLTALQKVVMQLVADRR